MTKKYGNITIFVGDYVGNKRKESKNNTKVNNIYGIYIFGKSFAESSENNSKLADTQASDNINFKNSNEMLSAENETEVNKIENLSEEELSEITGSKLKDGQTQQITKKEEVMEYLTKYRTNKDIPKGISVVVQEGRQGKQEITIKTIYDSFSYKSTCK